MSPFIKAGKPADPSLIDTRHVVAELYNMVNVPTAVWIDDSGTIVRPNEVAYALDTRQAFGMGDPERDYGTTFVNEVGKLRGKLYYDLLDLDGSGSNPEQEQVAKEGAERLRKLVERSS